MDALAAAKLVDAATSRVPAYLGPRKTTNTHEFYRYPARFTPEFARAAIATFSAPGDLVIDPFVGGGTSLVESRLAGRVAIGNDINRLATFVARIKSTVYSEKTLAIVTSWAEVVAAGLSLPSASAIGLPASDGYLRNVEGPDFWRLKRFIAAARAKATGVDDGPARDFIRCAILRVSQWALDMRDTAPSIPEFRSALVSNLTWMAESAREYARGARKADRSVATSHRRRTVIVTGRAQDLAKNVRIAEYGAPRLVLTSPPYPGVYVNYHRWKLYGRRETPLPFWIAGQVDGQGLAYYTMGARVKRGSLDRYFEELKASFDAIAALCDGQTTIVQVVGFSNPEAQLPRYLATMEGAGLREITINECATAKDGRLWREIPRRRWWTSTKNGTAKEVVLFHRLAQTAGG